MWPAATWSTPPHGPRGLSWEVPASRFQAQHWPEASLVTTEEVEGTSNLVPSLSSVLSSTPRKPGAEPSWGVDLNLWFYPAQR